MITAPTGAPLLSLDGITHAFGRVLALDGASLQVRAGTVHALLGENGAGKTTLMRFVFGLLRADRGTIRLRGEPVVWRTPAEALTRGIGMVHQHFTLVPSMTVAENVALGGKGGFDPIHAANRVRDVAARAGLALDPDVRIQDLPVGAQQRCEIVKALARDVQLLILDEPTAILAPAESTELLRWLRTFADAGNAVVLITHKLRDALAVSDDITVLHRGRTVLTTHTRDTSESVIAAAMLGNAMLGNVMLGNVMLGGVTAVPEFTAAPQPGRNTEVVSGTPATGPVVLRAIRASVHDSDGILRLSDASIDVHAGEIVGIAAIEGAGQSALLRLLAGRVAPSSGTVDVPPQVGFVPEDRHRDALLLDAPLFENTALRGAGGRTGLMDWPSFRAQTDALLRRFDVRAPGSEATARTLSGGNQQKFVLGRELDASREAIVVENPSRGLDFVATNAVHTALRAARTAGMAVVVYSSDLDEVLALADRMYALHNGTLRPVAKDRDAVGQAMLRGESTMAAE